MTAQLKLWLSLAALALLLLAGWGVRQHIRSDAVREFQLAAVQDSVKRERAATDSLASVERQKDGAREQALAKANANVQQGKALAAKNDSLVRQSANERARAISMLCDSLVSADSLRREIGRLVHAGAQDSASFARERDQHRQTVAVLLAAIAADSASLAAHEAREASLQALQMTLQRQIGLLKASQPSFVSQHVGVGVGYGCGAKGCEPVAAAIVRVWP